MVATRRIRASLALLAAAVSLTLPGCGDAAPAPKPDRFNPDRPTPKGSIGDAVRGTAHRREPQPARRPALIRPADPVVVTPEPLTAQDQAAVETYLNRLARLNVELSGISSTSEPDAVRQRVSPVADEVRASLDSLLFLSAGQRLTVERDFGVRRRSLQGQLDAHLDSLAGRPALHPVATLLADLPTLE